MPKTTEPLAWRMRPRTIDEIVGQQHIIGPSTPLYKMVKKGHVPSLLLYGEPGTGKTSLAYAIARTARREWVAINATAAGKRKSKRQSKRRAGQGTSCCLSTKSIG